MAYETSVGLTVYACEPTEVRHFLAVITGAVGDEQLVRYPGYERDTDALTLGANYGPRELGTVGWALDIVAPYLQQHAPGASWECHQGTFNDTDGWGLVYRYTPQLGLFQQNCDDEGDPIVFGSQLAKASRERSSPGDRWAAVRELYGAAWTEAFAALPDGERVAEPKRHDVVWDRKTGVIEVGDRELDEWQRHHGDSRDPSVRAVGGALLEDVLTRHGWMLLDRERGGLTLAARGRIWEGEAYAVAGDALAAAGAGS